MKPLALLTVLALAGCGRATTLGSTVATARPAETAQPAEGALPSLAPLVERLTPAVVSVTVTSQVQVDTNRFIPEEFRRFFNLPDTFKMPPRTGQGSGFVISDDGLILTNNHVVDGADEVEVTFQDGRKYEARIVGTDSRTDVALIDIEADGLQHLELGSSDDLRVGDWVMAIGNPFGLSHTVTVGIVSAKGRVLHAGPYDDFIQTDAAINPGNSGGPLFDMQGRVVGINTAIIPAADGIGFAIPIDMVKDILPDLKETGRVARGWIGVTVQPLTPELREAMDLDVDHGALVADVSEDGPASEAGIEPGDVIVELDGERIDDTTDLVRTVGRHHPDEKVEVVVIRDGKRKKLKVKLGERPDEQLLAMGLHGAPRADEGLGLKLQDGPDGVVVTQVDPESEAAKVLEEGDVIVAIDRRRVRSAAEALKLLREAKDAVLIEVLHDGNRRFVALKR